MATLIFGGRYWRALHRVPVSVRRALQATTEGMEGEASFPEPDDVYDIIPPTQHVYRRRIGASAWWLYYELRDDGAVVLVAVAIPVV